MLVRYDWEAASAAVAAKFGSEEGNENQFGVEAFFPDLFIGEAEDDLLTMIILGDKPDHLTT